MIAPGTGVRVYLACGVTDMRKGINGLSTLAQDVLRQKPTGGAVFAGCLRLTSALVGPTKQRFSGWPTDRGFVQYLSL